MSKNESKKMIVSSKSYPGTRDIYPQEMRFRSKMFSIIEEAIKNFAYEKMSGPLLESFEIYAAKSGEEIAEKQLYVFTDKGDRRVAIRPELTPTIARMMSAKLHELASIQRWYSIENFMRYERPQKGRLREFCQINVDLIGATGVYADFELLRTAQGIFTAFGATKDMYEIRINHRGFINDILVSYVGISQEQVNTIAKIMDKKDKVEKEKFITMLAEAGMESNQIERLYLIFEQDFLKILELVPDSKSAEELRIILDMGEELFGEKNPLKGDFSVVRGLAYYTGLVFEAYDKNTENPRALFGGGRYDNLVDLFHKQGGISGVGFAIGDVTFELFLRGQGLLTDNMLSIQKHMFAVDNAVPFVFFHKLSENLKAMESVYKECTIMLQDAVLAKTQNRSVNQESIKMLISHVNKNPFFDSERYADLSESGDLLKFLSDSLCVSDISVEIYPDPSISLGKQLQYANKAGIEYVWICGEPEIKKGIIKKKCMKSGNEVEYDLSTLEIY